MTVTAPADRRFLRAQVKPGRRRSPWRTWLRLGRAVLLLSLATWAAWYGTTRVIRSGALTVTRITINGNRRLSDGDLLALMDGLRGQNILAVGLDRWRNRVVTCPWVADAVFRRRLPSTVEVSIVERRAIAIGRFGDDLFLVDEHGGVIDEYGPRYADMDLPILDGLDPAGSGGASANERRAQLATRLLGAVGTRPDLAKHISQLNVSDPRDAVVLVDQDTARVRLGDDQFVERLQSYLELAPTLRDHVPAVDYVDLRFGERVYVGSRNGAEGAPAAAPGPAAHRPGPAANH